VGLAALLLEQVRKRVPPRGGIESDLEERHPAEVGILRRGPATRAPAPTDGAAWRPHGPVRGRRAGGSMRPPSRAVHSTDRGYPFGGCEELPPRFRRERVRLWTARARPRVRWERLVVARPGRRSSASAYARGWRRFAAVRSGTPLGVGPDPPWRAHGGDVGRPAQIDRRARAAPRCGTYRGSHTARALIR